MRVSENCLALIKKYEGLRLKAYLCPAGVWTIGYGHTGPDVTRGKVISRDEADRLLVKDVQKFTDGVVKRVAPKVPTQAQLDAMVSLSYNIGLGNFDISAVKRNFKAGKIAAAAESFKSWTKARDPKTGRLRPLDGLVRRRAEEARLFLSDADKRTVARSTGSKLVEVPESSVVPTAPKSLTKSREIIGGGVVGTGGVLQILDMVGVDDARQAKDQITELKHEQGFMQKFYIPEIASVLTVVLAAFIIWKRFKDRREGIR